MATSLARLVRQLRILDRQESSCCGLPFAQGLVVQVLRQGSLRMSAVASELGVAQSTATRLVAPLERSKLVTRRPAPQDGRVVEVGLTPLGQEVAADLHGGLTRCCEDLLDKIPASRREQVVESLELISGAAGACCGTAC